MADTEAAAASAAPRGSSGGGGGGGGIGSAVQAAATIATTINGIVLAGKQQDYMQALSSLDQRQQIELAEKLQHANSNSEKLQILSSSLTQYLIANDTQAKRSSVILYAAAGVIALVLLGIVVYMNVKSKK